MAEASISRTFLIPQSLLRTQELCFVIWQYFVRPLTPEILENLHRLFLPNGKSQQSSSVMAWKITTKYEGGPS